MHGLKLPLALIGLAVLLAGPVLAQLPDDPPPDEAFASGYEAFTEPAPGSGFILTDTDVADRAHAALLRDGDLQFVRPEAEPVELTPPDPPPSWLRAIGEFLDALGPFFQVMFWIAVAAVVAGLLYFIFGEAVRLRFSARKTPRHKNEDDVLVDIRPDAAAARSLLDDADALAREGRFAEAVHLLLFRSIEDIQARLEGGVPASLTAREIAGLGRLPDRAKRALGPIIEVVERSFFGGRAVDAGGWHHARRSYEDFAFGEGWSA
ncbi:MAG: DUF4129 domain-containing protein [Hyphomonas sp.]|jgi:hypothetical protein